MWGWRPGGLRRSPRIVLFLNWGGGSEPESQCDGTRLFLLNIAPRSTNIIELSAFTLISAPVIAFVPTFRFGIITTLWVTEQTATATRAGEHTQSMTTNPSFPDSEDWCRNLRGSAVLQTRHRGPTIKLTKDARGQKLLFQLAVILVQVLAPITIKILSSLHCQMKPVVA